MIPAALQSARAHLSEDADVDEYMFAQGWSDGLPLVSPTCPRVRRMLQGTARSPDDCLGKCPPMYSTVTVEKAAINAVLAGCEPKQFRVVLAATEAMLSEAFNLHGVSATTMGATPCVIVNGPVRAEAGLNYSLGALGSGSRANASVGRALKLILQNVGGAKLGGTESTTLGTPMKFTLCAAEAEEELAGSWDPYHCERGFSRGESAVTVLAVTSGPHQLVDFSTRDSLPLCELLAGALATMYNPTIPMVNECLIVISPEHQRTLIDGGITSKEELRTALWHLSNKHMNTTLSAAIRMVKPGFTGALLAGVMTLLGRAVNLAGVVLVSLLLKHWKKLMWIYSLVVGRLAPKFLSPESFHVITAGSSAGKFSAACPGFGAGRPPAPTANLSQAVTVGVEAAPLALSASEESMPTLVLNDDASSSSITLLDPTGELNPSPFSPTLRTSPTLADGDVALLDISKQNGSVLLDHLERLLWREFPSVRTRRFCKPTFSRPAPAELLHEIAESCKYVIAALAD